MGSDGASLGWTVDAFVDPISYRAGDANLYRYCGNSPVMYVDPFGLKIVVGPYPDSADQKLVDGQLDKIRCTPEGKAFIDKLEQSPHVIQIGPRTDPTQGNSTDHDPNSANDPSKGADSTVRYNPRDIRGGVDDKGSYFRPAYVGLAHELGHAEAAAEGKQPLVPPRTIPVAGTTPDYEANAMKRENEVRSQHGQNLRSCYWPKNRSGK